MGLVRFTRRTDWWNTPHAINLTWCPGRFRLWIKYNVVAKIKNFVRFTLPKVFALTTGTQKMVIKYSMDKLNADYINQKQTRLLRFRTSGMK